ncbi:MAG: PQQ-dependent sugar dehydrogenase, partial [Nakamurella sp.]
MEKHRSRTLAIALFGALSVFVGCSSGTSTAPLPASTTFALPDSGPVSTLPDLTVSTIATGLTTPWGLAFLPDGRAVVTGRDDGSITLIDTSGAQPTATGAGVIDGVDHGGEGGLLGVAVSPTFARDSLLYVYFTGADGNQIDTVTLRNNELTEQQRRFGGIPKGSIHNGGRLAFGPDGLLYVGTGENGDRENAQDPASLGGKILRFTPELLPAPGNPFGTAVYSLGHRNVQGL